MYAQAQSKSDRVKSIGLVTVVIAVAILAVLIS